VIAQAALALALGALGLTGALAGWRLARAVDAPDLLVALQLIAAKTVAALCLLAALTGVAALAETALALALLGAVGAAVFAQKARGR